jgi:hypothetical protein
LSSVNRYHLLIVTFGERLPSFSLFVPSATSERYSIVHKSRIIMSVYQSVGLTDNNAVSHPVNVPIIIPAGFTLSNEIEEKNKLIRDLQQQTRVLIQNLSLENEQYEAKKAKAAAEKAAHNEALIQHQLTIVSLNEQLKEKEIRINLLVEEKMKQEERISVLQSLRGQRLLEISHATLQDWVSDVLKFVCYKKLLTL